MLLPPASVAATLREWLALVPEKVLFATDAYPFSDELGWEESGWIGARERAVELARMVLRENARMLYGL